jgi:hypothetical protein
MRLKSFRELIAGTYNALHNFIAEKLGGSKCKIQEISNEGVTWIP